jgi:hypothetical protein
MVARLSFRPTLMIIVLIHNARPLGSFLAGF